MVGNIRTNYLFQAYRIEGTVYEHVTEQSNWSTRESDTQSLEVKSLGPGVRPPEFEFWFQFLLSFLSSCLIPLSSFFTCGLDMLNRLMK